MKKFFSLLIAIIVLNLTIINGYCDTVNPYEEQFNFFFDLYHGWNNKYDNKPETPADFINWFLDGVNSNNVTSLISRAFLDTTGQVALSPWGADIVEDGLQRRYKVSKLKKEVLEALASDLTSVSDGNFDFKQLGDYSLNTGCDIQESIRIGGGSGALHNGGTYGVMPIESYIYDLSHVSIGSGEIAIYRGGCLPPLMYIPTGSRVTQDDVAIASGIYAIIGDNQLLKFPKYVPSTYIGSYFYIPTNGTDEDLVLKYGTNASLDSDGFLDPQGRTSTFDLYSSGTKVTAITTSSTPNALNTALRWRSSANDIIKISENPIQDDPPLPDNVPYDDDDYVIVMIPAEVNNINNTFFNGDIIYMNPDDYETYVNNGTIVEGDYINDYSQNEQTIIYNFYNSTTNNNTGTNTGSFDDSNIINRLDTIIRKLDTIIDNIGNRAQQMNVIFNSDPVYDDFSDCITENLPIVNEIKSTINSIDTNNSKSAFADVPTVSNNGNVLQNVYSGLDLSLTGLTWYEPYRIRIRNLLKIPVYIMGLASIWLAIRSVFGVQTGGGGAE